MEFKPWYPSDFGLVLSNTFSEKQVDTFLAQPGCSPRFVYGILMLPTVLKYYVDVDQAVHMHRNMTQATLFGYQLHQFAESSTPVIARSSDPQASVEGVLVFNLDEQQRNSIYELEGGLMNLVSVTVEIFQKDRRQLHGIRRVDAGTFAWQGSRTGLTPMSTTAWTMDDYLASPFYENIVRSQNTKQAFVDSNASDLGRRSSSIGSSPAASYRRRGSEASYSSRRFESSLESIREEMDGK